MFSEMKLNNYYRIAQTNTLGRDMLNSLVKIIQISSNFESANLL